MPNKIVAAVEKHPVIASVVVGGIGILATIYFVQKAQGNQNSVTGVPTDAAGNPLTGGFTVSPPLSNSDLSTMLQDLEQQILDWEQQFQSQNSNGSGNNSSGSGSSNNPAPTGFPVPITGSGSGDSGGNIHPTGFPIPIFGNGGSGNVIQIGNAGQSKIPNPADKGFWNTLLHPTGFPKPIRKITGNDTASHGGSIISSPASHKKWGNLNPHIWGAGGAWRTVR